MCIRDRQHTAGIPAHAPDAVDVPALQGGGSGQAHEQHRHIEPPGIVGVVKEDKGAVEPRHQGHEQAEEQQLFQPAAPGRQQEEMCIRDRADLMQQFPNGKYWNHVGMSDNNQDGYTNTPCPSHGKDNTNLSTCNCYKLNGMVKAWQCQGFVIKCGYDAYGSDPYTWSQITGSNALNNLKPGDIVRYYINGIDDDNLHSIFVTSVSGDTITFGDCNADLQCGIRWGAQTTKQKLQLKPVDVYKRQEID